MRQTLLCVLLLASAGCASLAGSIARAGTAVGLGLEAATVAVLEGTLGGAPAVSASVVLSTASFEAEAELTIGGEARAPTAADGSAYDCVDAECKGVPPELAAWCAPPRVLIAR